MQIRTINKYVYKGKEYDSLKAVKDAVENTIGEEVLDPICRKIDIPHKDILKLHEILCKPEIRKALLECYNVTYIETSLKFDSSDIYQGEEETELNILDLK